MNIAIINEVKGRWGKNPVRLFLGKRYHYDEGMGYFSNKGGQLSHMIWNHYHPNDMVLSNEVIHHKNGNKSDDRIENYEKCTRGQHMRLHEVGCHNGPCSEETKKKLSIAHLGKPIHSDKHKAELSLKMKENNPMYKIEVRKKISDALSGRVFSEETIKKMSESAKRRPSNRKGAILSEETKRKMAESRQRRYSCANCSGQ